MPSRTGLRPALVALLAVALGLPAFAGAVAAAPPFSVTDHPLRAADTGPAGPATVAVGPDHACAVVAGRVECWGANASGQLGDGTRTRRGTPARVLGPDGATPLDGVRSVAAGLAFSCAVRTDGRVWCWGAGADGQLGTGARRRSLLPVPVVGLLDATAISAGLAHACAIRAAGSLVCWGRNTHGELGDATTRTRALPVPVGRLSAVTAVAAGDTHTCATRGTDGAVLCWGANGSGQLGTGRLLERHVPAVVGGILGTAVAIAAGARHSCAITSADMWFFGPMRITYCWGDNASGQVTPGPTRRYLKPTVTYSAWNAQDVIAGATHTCTTSDYGMSCWGANRSGQLGEGTRTRAGGPSRTGLGIVSGAAAGGATTCAVETNAAWVTAGWCWGANGSGQVGDGTATDRSRPTQVLAVTVEPPLPALVGSLGIATTAYSSCSILGDHTVWCWGDNSIAELGDATADRRALPVAVRRLSGAAALTSGNAYTCATLQSGAVRCWGDNSSGQLGDGTTNPRSSPVLAKGVLRPRSLVAGSYHTCAVLQDASVACWGANGAGQLGDGTVKDRRTPVPVAGLSDVQEIAPGAGHTCALRHDGSVWCWGDNSAGQLGDGTFDSRRAPVVVPGLAGVTAVSSRESTTCALLGDGSAACWGDGAAGQLGDSRMPLSPVPVPVPSIIGAKAIAVGSDHACAIVADGTVACWGANDLGQLGDGTFTRRTSPVVVSGLTGATALAANGSHSCAVIGPQAAVVCWGAGDSSQIGNGLPAHAPRPAQVIGP
jgi:alpha-tubulin suppressor-like RCC1 family protein